MKTIVTAMAVQSRPVFWKIVVNFENTQITTFYNIIEHAHTGFNINPVNPIHYQVFGYLFFLTESNNKNLFNLSLHFGLFPFTDSSATSDLALVAALAAGPSDFSLAARSSGSFLWA